MSFEFFVARRFLKSNKSKNTISSPIVKVSVSAIAIGVFIMLISISAAAGLQMKIKEKVSAFKGHYQLYHFDNANSDISITPMDASEIDWRRLQENVPSLERYYPVIQKAGIIRTEITFEGIIAKGVDSEYNFSAFEEFIGSGRIPNYQTDKPSKEVLISAQKAKLLKLRVGDSFNAYFLKENDPSGIPNTRKFEVAGIYNSGFDEFDELFVFVDQRHLQMINRWSDEEFGHYELFISDFDEIDTYTETIYNETPSTIDVATIKQSYYTVFEWIKLFDFNVVIIIIIMLLVGGINMITALLVLIIERTQSIGLLKALGATSSAIRKLFLIKALNLIVKGVLIGNAAFLSLYFAQKQWGFLKFPNPEQYYVEVIPLHLEWSHLLAVNAGVIISCILMLIIPTVAIANIVPSKVMKFN